MSNEIKVFKEFNIRKNLVLLVLFFMIVQVKVVHAQTYPFPRTGTYVSGVISTKITTTNTQNAYNNWATGAASGVPTSSPSNGPGYLKNCGGGKYSVSNGSGVFSEGIGYGMLLTAYMGDKTAFDGLWAFYKSNMDANGLMNWTGGSFCGSTSGNAATDGDEDAAMALIIASEQWPAGTYAADAKTLIGNIKLHETSSSCSSPSVILLPGDAAGFGSCNCMNASYFAPAYYRVWACFMNDPFWNTLADDTYISLNNAINAANGNTGTGLVPAWQTNAGVPGGTSCNGTSNYQYDACRTPWRIGLDYLWFGTPAAKTYLNTVSNWVKGGGGGISNIGDGYNLNGTKTSSFRNSAFLGPFAVSAMASTQADVDNFTDFWINENPVPGSNKIDDAPYFQNSLRALTMLTASGTMWKPDFCGPKCRQPALGADLTTCGSSFPYTLNSNTPTASGVTFTWKRITPSPSTLVTSSSTQNTFSVTSAMGAGTYAVIRDSTGGCTGSDTIVISSTLLNPVISPAGPINLCNPASINFTVSNAASFPAGTTWQWYNGTGSTVITGATATSLSNVRTAATYKVIASIGGCASTFDQEVVTSSLPTPVDGCASSGNILLSIANPGLGAGPYQWYNAGGTALATGTSYNASSPGTYYVQDMSAVSLIVGPTTALSTPGGGNGYTSKGASTSQLLNFTTKTANVTIDYVTVYAITYAATNLNFTIQLYNSAGVAINTGGSPALGTFTGVAASNPSFVAYRVPVNITIPTAGNYKLGIGMAAADNGNMWYYQGGAAPAWASYTSSALDITGNSTSANDYSFMYKWEISTGTACARLPVIATNSGCAPSPVKLISFYANNEGPEVLLNWATATELNNDHFIVERSGDGYTFGALANVKGSGNSNIILYYSYTDNWPVYGTSYYRLVQYDMDGTMEYSPVIAVTKTDLTSLEILPNPFSDITDVYVKSLVQEKVQIKIVDLTGKVLMTSDEYMTNEHISIGSDFPDGMYIVEVLLHGRLYYRKMVKG